MNENWRHFGSLPPLSSEQLLKAVQIAGALAGAALVEGEREVRMQFASEEGRHIFFTPSVIRLNGAIGLKMTADLEDESDVDEAALINTHICKTLPAIAQMISAEVA